MPAHRLRSSSQSVSPTRKFNCGSPLVLVSKTAAAVVGELVTAFQLGPTPGHQRMSRREAGAIGLNHSSDRGGTLGKRDPPAPQGSEPIGKVDFRSHRPAGILRTGQGRVYDNPGGEDGQCQPARAKESL